MKLEQWKIYPLHQGEQMEINFSLPREIEANVAKRTITGLIAPYDAVGYTSAGEVVFKEGAFGDIQASAIKLLSDHEMSKPIGKMVNAESRADGVYATFKLGSSTRATDSLIEASEGLKNGLSVGARITDYETDPQGRMIVTAASLKEVSLVTEPAFAEARVLEVAASATPEETEKEEPMSEPTKDEVVEAAPAVEAAAPEVEAAKPTVALAYTKPRSGITTSASYLEHKIKAAHGNHESALWVAASDDTSNNTGLTLAPHLTEFITNTIDGRPSIEAVSRGALPASGLSFTIPKLSQAPQVTEVAEDGDTAAGNEMTSTYITVDVKKLAKSETISWELIERSSPEYMNELMRELRRAYARISDEKVFTKFITDGTQATAQAADIDGLVGFVATESAAAYSAAGSFARNIVANSTWWGKIMGFQDSSKRPLFTAAAPSNATGNASATSLVGNVMGLGLYVDPFIGAGDGDDSMFIIAPEAMTYYESPVTNLTVQVLGNGQTTVSLHGYYAIATKIAGGVRRWNKS
jgi:HK97 family phage major capsid protein